MIKLFMDFILPQCESLAIGPTSKICFCSSSVILHHYLHLVKLVSLSKLINYHIQLLLTEFEHCHLYKKWIVIPFELELIEIFKLSNINRNFQNIEFSRKKALAIIIPHCNKTIINLFIICCNQNENYNKTIIGNII